jgi:hypothetical protein
MTTHLHSFASGRVYSLTLLALAALISGFLMSANAKAQEEMADNSYLSLKDRVFEGTVNSVHSDSSMLIVDDHSFVLDRVVQFNNTSWSRDQAVKRIGPGNRVKLELGGVADVRSSARIVRSITVIDQ